MTDEERIEQLELEVKVLRANNKGLKDKIDEQSKEIEVFKNKKPTFLIKDLYNPKLKEVKLQDVEGLIEQGREEIKAKIKAKIEELDDLNSPFAQRVIKGKEVYLTEMVQNILQSLLEKE